ncbi:hypothetical protein BDP81DRAFT_438134 [Colletotrichum phormii]|uniref:Uncharacterized protein n=1 Tax=Colletotrichum phormii TaxID=359342 RepID=A0AAI9ZGW2_9PEZI|nr:uncharacterized protein BDP81DRAFT_438134 [Colletotrichum phormii]KAK1624236.1 hypothetical protein BDP81DRAFT_438134 [Colletotrichum phormii]
MPIRSHPSLRQQTDKTHGHEGQIHRNYRQQGRPDSLTSHLPAAQRAPAPSRAHHRLAPACFPSFRLTKFAYHIRKSLPQPLFINHLLLGPAALYLSLLLDLATFEAVQKVSCSFLITIVLPKRRDGDKGVALVETGVGCVPHLIAWLRPAAPPLYLWT